MSGTSLDIKKLKEQVCQLQVTIDNIGAYIYTKDINGKYTFANKMVCDLFELPPEKIIGSGDEIFFDTIRSDELLKYDKRVIEHGEKVEGEEKNYIKKTGEQRTYWVVKFPLYDSSGIINGMCGISTDITERLRMEQEIKNVNLMLTTVLNNTPLLIYMKDISLNYTFVNKNFAEFFGIKQEGIIRKRDIDFMPDEIARHISSVDSEVLRSGKKTSGEEVLFNFEGEASYYEALRIPLIANDVTYALVGILYDTTDVTLLKRQLEDQNEALIHMLEQKNLFLGTVVHDLRNPIGAILGISEIIVEQVNDANKKLPKLISEISSGMLDLVNDLLDISEIEGGKLTLHKHEVDYISLVEQNIGLNEFLANKKNIKIVKEFEIKQQLINLDKGKIEQVMNNLLSNAIKYSNPDKKITVQVFLDNGNIITQVRDEGQGIPQNEIKDIFQYFKRASVSPTGNEKSHGLGLAIVKKIIEGHNGHISVESEFGKGSVFKFSLPVN